MTIIAATAMASETISYTYDARGRLVKVQRRGSVNNNVATNYSYDKGDNRTNVNVTSPNPPP
jgi:YD repeat-containing protein